MFDIVFDGKTIQNYGILVKKRPSIPAPKRRRTEIEIPGMDGVLIEDDGSYEPISFPVEFNFLTEPDLWHDVFRTAKDFFEDVKTMEMEDDQDFFLRILKADITDSERASIRNGKFSVEFLCEPYMYQKNGIIEQEIINGKIFNPFRISHPTYILTGNGACDLIVNEKTLKATVNGTLFIDTEKKIAYNEEIVSQNNVISGDYEDLYMVPGENTVSITNGIALKVKPFWRCL